MSPMHKGCYVEAMMSARELLRDWVCLLPFGACVRDKPQWAGRSYSRGNMQKTQCRKALRESPSGKKGSCFGEGCMKGTLWLSKQA